MFEDHFSELAAEYAVFRPTYPSALFAALGARAPGRALAWDVGCGSGQASLGLAGVFERVIATDPSAEQIARATPYPGVAYRVATAEHGGLDDRSADLILAAQAAHWFELPAFEAEVRRVARPGGLLALVGYRLVTVEPEVDEVVRAYAEERVGPWWPAGRALLDAGYATLALGLPEEPPVDVTMCASWSLDHLLGYLATWSSTKRCRQQTGIDPLPDVARRLAQVWGPPGRSRTVRWPLINRIFRVP